MMKLNHEVDGNRLTVILRGELEGSRCSCLEHFWQKRVASQEVSELFLDMTDVEDMDALAIATLTSLLRTTDIASVTVDSAPQNFAHTLYKTAMLIDPARMRLINEVQEEPYAG